ncbi:xylanolytic transcriptional activator xlnR [Aspergillus udagawae]|uniref:Xylanolytic transcriptional activator xlnR n=1 Tax=Aspergillus udagawae TaxID=91492 RepID=A0A8H3SEQ8_9EURO|nr:xylanolytic transcriptional activator xlnR [Aspergillus udagawae]
MPPSHACDACKRRKVKCDGVDPCANCRIAHLVCGYSARPARRGRPVIRALSPRAATSSASHPDTRTVVGHASGPNYRYHTPSAGTHVDRVEGLSEIQQQISQSHLHQGSVVILSPVTGESGSLFTFHYHPGQIHTHLVTQLMALLTSKSIADMVHGCIDFFLQYLFPNTPVVHENTLREGVVLLTPDGHSTFADLAFFSYGHPQTSHLKTFTLVTALCAFVTSLTPSSLSTSRASFSRPFLLASRAMLMVYEEYDLEYPDSTSLAIRMWHSAALQNTTGRAGASYHHHAQAAFLAQRLRLYDESAVQRHSQIESQLLRAMFWLLYLADKTAFALGTRPLVLDVRLFDAELTLLENGSQDLPLLSNSKKVVQGSLERRLFFGFHLKRRVWTSAADLLANIKSLALRKNRGTSPAADHELQVARLAEAYLFFTSLADQLPIWLKHPDTGTDSLDDDVVAYQRACFWIQRSNIMTVFHCMKLVILQTCLDNNLQEIIGLNDRAMSWATRKIEIVRDFLYELQVAPFEYFQVQGETAIERVRRVGSILLELVHHAENETIEKIVRPQFEQLLDFLAKLDSKASDELARA